jgi:hypothetical protein
VQPYRRDIRHRLRFVALQMYWHSLIWVAALWAITFPGTTASLAAMFGRAQPPVERPAAVPA